MNVNPANTSRAAVDVPAVASITMPDLSSSEKNEKQGAESDEHVKEMVKEMQSRINVMNASLQFVTYGDRGDKIAVVVADKDTGEVIREIPTKELRHLYSKMKEITGIIFNKEA